MKVGVIGTGNMGTIIIESLIEASAIEPSQLFITNRTISKTEPLKATHPSLQVVDSARELTQNSDIIFICVKPAQISSLLETIKDLLSPRHILVSITSPVSVNQLEAAVDCKVARIIPSITNRALAGASLFSFSRRLSHEDKEQLLSLFEEISSPVLIDESITRVASDISSCGPAFLSYILEEMITAAVETTSISRDQATQLMTEMAIGFGKLLEKDIYSFETLKEKVRVKGGVTGVGLDVLEKQIGGRFTALYEATEQKFKEDHALIDPHFPSVNTKLN
ncbi:pyrroline-5-carboxylate reductase [Pullulanibacillus camelliae]|uniref:Pyrroline-5-carboxylate reductase n=1 Tax=Pullulanibacillus camelliae TaxID=1707096 RepID=A0A8J2YHN8_9BACL|nr:late competence protein ComER [Pullulanibacillus camelliae]GGE43395.1 pyrroline-5-carboxylate reductase [Pullulanibacillus camelliae]